MIDPSLFVSLIPPASPEANYSRVLLGILGAMGFMGGSYLAMELLLGTGVCSGGRRARVSRLTAGIATFAITVGCSTSLFTNLEDSRDQEAHAYAQAQEDYQETVAKREAEAEKAKKVITRSVEKRYRVKEVEIVGRKGGQWSWPTARDALSPSLLDSPIITVVTNDDQRSIFRVKYDNKTGQATLIGDDVGMKPDDLER